MPGTKTQPKRSMKNAHPRRLLTSLFVIMLCLAVFSAPISALSGVLAAGSPTLKEGGIRIDEPKTGTFKYGDKRVETNPKKDFTPADFEIKFVVRDTKDGMTLDFVSNYPVGEVVVKGGPQGALRYVFDKAVTSAEGLHAPAYGAPGKGGSGKYADIDHVDFYLCPPPAVSPAIDIEKYVSADNGKTWQSADKSPGPDIAFGTDPQFKFVVKNTGNVPLRDIRVTDDAFNKLLQEALAGKVPECLEPGDSFSAVICAAWAPGQHENTAKVCARYEKQEVEDLDKAFYNGAYGPVSIDVEKDISTDGGKTWQNADDPGIVILRGDCDPMFRISVKNTGKMPLRNISLTDDTYNDLLQAALAGKLPECLEPGDDFCVEFTAPWQEGEHCNTAEVCATFYQIKAEDSDKAHYSGIVPCPDIDVEKLVSVDGGQTWHDADFAPGPKLAEAAGIDPMFKFVVTNKGNVPLKDVVLLDTHYLLLLKNLPDGSIPDSLAAGESFEVVITAPWHSGQHINLATVMACWDKVIVKDIDSACYYGEEEVLVGIDVEKLVSVDGGTTWHDADTPAGPELCEDGADPMFRFVVKNTGEVCLTDIKLTDSDFAAQLAALPAGSIPASLDAGKEFTVTITVPWSAGQHANTAAVSGVYGKETYSDTDMAHYFGAVPAIDVQKTVANQSAGNGAFGELALLQVGETAVYKVVVKNTGNIALSDVSLSDDQVAAGTVAAIEGGGTKTFAMGAGTEPAILLGSLEPGASVTVTYTRLAAEADAGETIENVAMASGTGCAKTVSDSDTAAITVEELPLAGAAGVSLEKMVQNITAGGAAGKEATGFVGDSFSYTIKITNTGETDLTNVTLHDTFAKPGTAVAVKGTTTVLTWGSDAAGQAKLTVGTLAVGESMTFTYLYTAAAGDTDKALNNLAHVTADEGVEDSDTAVIHVQEAPPQTGESGSSSQAWGGLALVLSGLSALLLRRKFRFMY